MPKGSEKRRLTHAHGPAQIQHVNRFGVAVAQIIVHPLDRLHVAALRSGDRSIRRQLGFGDGKKLAQQRLSNISSSCSVTERYR